MKILITGGCGFVGSNLAIYLEDNLKGSKIYSVNAINGDIYWEYFLDWLDINHYGSGGNIVSDKNNIYFWNTGIINSARMFIFYVK